MPRTDMGMAIGDRGINRGDQDRLVTDWISRHRQAQAKPSTAGTYRSSIVTADAGPSVAVRTRLFGG